MIASSCVSKLISPSLLKSGGTFFSSPVFRLPRHSSNFKMYSTESRIPKNSKDFGKRGPVTWKSFLATAGITGGLLAFMLHVRKEKEIGNYIIILTFSLLIVFFQFFLLHKPSKERGNAPSARQQ